MKLVSFAAGENTRVGVVSADGKHIVPLQTEDTRIASDMNELIALGSEGLGMVKQRLAKAERNQLIAIDDAKLLAPIPRPNRNIFCVGKNYREHASEFNASGYDSTGGDQAVPADPIIFTKAPSSVIAPGDSIVSELDPTSTVDYEGELAVVIGKSGRAISRHAAGEYVYGYTILNDVTARGLQFKHQQWFLGKSLDTFCPMGPYLVTADEIDDIGSLRLQTEVNGEIRQNARIAELIFDIPTLIETISRGITLAAGDIIATGTPLGVGIGFNPPKFLSKGDVVSITIDRLGTLSNPVV